MGRRWPVQDLFGIPIAALTMADVLDAVERAIDARERLLIGVVNAAKVVNMRRDRELGASVRSSDLILADGFSVVMAARLLGRPLPERVTGIDLMRGMLALGHQRRYRIYCLGATVDVLADTERHIADAYAGVQIVGRHHGYFSEADASAVAGDIARSRADILFVAMSSPKKETFLAAWGPTTGVPVCHGVGGAFDVLAGKVQRAPERWQRLGLEWLFRVKQEPRRLWKRYLVTNTMFLALLAAELCRTAPDRLAGPRAGRPV